MLRVLDVCIARAQRTSSSPVLAESVPSANEDMFDAMVSSKIYRDLKVAVFYLDVQLLLS